MRCPVCGVDGKEYSCMVHKSYAIIDGFKRKYDRTRGHWACEKCGWQSEKMPWDDLDLYCKGADLTKKISFTMRIPSRGDRTLANDEGVHIAFDVPKKDLERILTSLKAQGLSKIQVEL